MTIQIASFSAETRYRSLSPSRAADFKTCPLLYRLRTIDRLPQQPSALATRGTLVHAVLERLFELPAASRTLDAAKAMVPGMWDQLLEDYPELQQIVVELQHRAVATTTPAEGTATDADANPVAEPPENTAPVAEPAEEIEPELPSETEVIGEWLDSAGKLLESYFVLEDPTRIQPEGRELMVEYELPDGPVLRGIIDRLDATVDGHLRVVDYKTGVTPREAFEAKALFQMKFYALVIYRLRGVVPRQLRLLYLGDKDMLSYTPEADELDRFEGTLRAIWAAIQRGVERQDFRPSPSRLCNWCDYKPLCPAWGGITPPYPVAETPIDEPTVAPD